MSLQKDLRITIPVNDTSHYCCGDGIENLVDILETIDTIKWLWISKYSVNLGNPFCKSIVKILHNYIDKLPIHLKNILTISKIRDEVIYQKKRIKQREYTIDILPLLESKGELFYFSGIHGYI